MTDRSEALPQTSGRLFLTDAGLDADPVLDPGVEIRGAADHTLLESAAGRYALARYFRRFLVLARNHRTGYVFDGPTWRAHTRWARALSSTEAELHQANRDAVNFIADLRDEFSGNDGPIVLNGTIGPHGDTHAPGTLLSPAEAEDYHERQVGWLAETDVEMVTAHAFAHSPEAAGIVNAARKVGLPIVVAFTVENDGLLPSGQPLGDAIAEVDAATRSATAYYMVHCADPGHLRDALEDDAWLRRIRGLRCNLRRRGCAELDANPRELSERYVSLLMNMPWINVLGGCCDPDLRQVEAIAAAAHNIRPEPGI